MNGRYHSEYLDGGGRILLQISGNWDGDVVYFNLAQDRDQW
jgi:hypothetical protein